MFLICSFCNWACRLSFDQLSGRNSLFALNISISIDPQDETCRLQIWKVLDNGEKLVVSKSKKESLMGRLGLK